MSQRSGRKPFVLVVLLLLLAVIGTVSYFGWRQSVPAPHALGAPPRLIGHKTPVTISVEAARGHIARAEVRLVQGAKSAVVAKSEAPGTRRADLAFVAEVAALGLREGDATWELWARDDFRRPLRLDDGHPIARFPVRIDLTPPKIEVLGATPYLAPGGTGLVAFRVSDATQAEVRVGTQVFPSFAMGPPDRAARVALIALPYDMAPGTPMVVTAQDEAGNVASRGIPGEVLPRRFPHDTIQLKDAFLQAKVPELFPQYPPDKPLIDGFLVINRDQRRQAEEEKRKIGAKTADKPLWDGAFIQPRNTKVFSNFAETRTYFYQGREVDRQVHYGFDLASTKQSPVPAANKGVVAFTGPLTIYGNAVVIDHGLGLQTLYGHLSSIDVKPGDAVEKGQEIARTGSTGLAMGDHLHYEVLVDGLSVTPVEWWDAKWIRDRITRPLAQAGLVTVGADEPSTPASDTPAPTPPRRRARRSR